MDLAEMAAFAAAVFLVLAFSQCWIMAITGPGPGPIDPAVSASVRNYLFPVYAVTLFMVAAWPGATATAMVRSPALMVLIGVTIASIAWSIDPSVTMRRCVALVFTTLAGLVIAARFSWPTFLEVFATALGITVVLSFVIVALVPHYGIMFYDFPGAWRGVWSHKNTLGYYMSVSIMVFSASAIANPQRRWIWIGCIAGAVVLILMSQSKTSLVSCLLGAVTIPLIAIARRGPVWAVASIYVAVTAAVAAAAAALLFPDLLLGLVGKDATLTGRTQIWAAVMRQIVQRPITGYGYGAVWDSTSMWGPLPWISKEQGFTIHEAHNTWLGIWLELGYFGLVAWTLLFVGVWLRTLGGFLSGAGAYFALPFLMVYSLHSFTEAVALGPNELIWLMFSATAVKLATRDRSLPVRRRATASEIRRPGLAGAR